MLIWLPSGTRVAKLAKDGLAPGLLSAGLGTVPAQQTYLDITQGNRVFDSLYDTKLPPLAGDCSKWWRAVIERADSAPAEIVPGLLSSTLEAAGVEVLAGGGTSCTFSAHSPSDGPSRSTKKLSEAPRQHLHRSVFEVREARLGQLPSLVRSLHGNDLLLAIERPPPAKNRALAVGIAGHGFSGDLISDSTRTDGYVLSTDLAPTILERFGVATFSQVAGQPVRGEGAVDPAAIESLADRMAEISSRRGPVIGLSLLLWVLLLGSATAATSGRAARPAVRLTSLTIVYLPLVLLAGVALEPSEGAEALIVALGSPLLAIATLATLRGYRALAFAAAATVLAYAVDVIVGSPLSALSLLGPNPGLGVRFYGIGNELEALLAVLVVGGTGAGIAGFRPGWSRRACAQVFLAAGIAAAFVFAAGRFGADVGAAIVFPTGAAVAAAAIAARRRRAAVLVVAAPFAALALLALVDLLSGASAHLTRSVLDAGGLGSLADVAQRRLQLSAHSFTRPILFAFLPVIGALAALAVARRNRLRAWVAGVPAVRAGLIGGVAATAVGTLANDSGALLLEIGAAYLLVFIGFAWAESGPAGRRSESRDIDADKKLQFARNA
jgi:hypothetical protein